MTSIVISDRISESELVRALRALTLANRTVRLTCFGAALALLASAVYLARGAISAPSIGLYTAGAVALFSAFYLYMTWRIPVINARQYFTSSPEAKDQLTWTLSEGGIEVATSKSRTHVAWDGITAATENSDFLFLYRAAANALVLPWRAVSAGDQLAVRQLLHLVLGGRAKDLQVK